MDKPVVLVADDNEATCTLVAALLRNEYVVDVVSDGNEAVEKLKRRQYAAILVDLLMPIADGYAILDYLTAERPDLLRHVIVVTGSLTARELQRVRAYDICAVVAKPFEVSLLQEAVRHCAGPGAEPFVKAPLLSSGMLLLLADVLRRF